MRTSLQNKTVRPGLLTYSSYHSYRRPVSATPTRSLPAHRRTGGYKWGRLIFTLAVIAGLILGFQAIVKQQSNNVANNAGQNTGSYAATSVAGNKCAGNVQAKFIVVSVSARHLWACKYRVSIYDSPVVTGIETLPADKTPRGTFHIYAKQTNITLSGSDSTGAWSDPVYYWMPFLANQYGTYGFHDATWRPDSAFGHINPTSRQASHGCVELPLSASQWLYNWIDVGTTVTIQN